MVVAGRGSSSACVRKVTPEGAGVIRSKESVLVGVTKAVIVQTSRERSSNQSTSFRPYILCFV